MRFTPLWGRTVKSKLAFNSLYEIPYRRREDRTVTVSSFNSLYEIRMSLELLFFRIIFSFNSLYEIRLLIRSWQGRPVRFQFSLWDSDRDTEMDMWKQRILSILSMRFRHRKGSDQEAWIILSILSMRFLNRIPTDAMMLMCFQFSLWDSYLGGGKFAFFYDVFQFSLWDSRP